jgi:hypothetical protein
MESLNKFNSMNSDLSKFIQNNDKYLKALNLRPVTTLGESNGGLTNIMGNNCEITFPLLRGVYKLKIQPYYTGDEFVPQTVILTINGQSTTTITLDLNTRPKDIVPYIKNLTNCYQNTFNTYKTFAVAYDNEYIYIYQNPEYRLCSTNESVEPTIVLTKGGVGTELIYITPTGTTSTSQTPFIPANNSYDKLIIIGSTYIGEDNYLFTCVENNTQKTGNIWKLTYDELAGFSYIKLLNNSYLNFDINYPIPPTATNGRYELPTIQRIYWSDFNNPVRSLNVASENTMSFNSIVIDLKPSLEMSIPTLKTITAGNGTEVLSCATPYYFAYRLVKNNDTVTNYSPMSNGVKLIKQDTGAFLSPSANFSSITGTDLNGNVETVNKSITIEVSGVDTNYDKIEFVVIKGNATDNSLYEIFKYEEQLIGNSSIIESEFTNDTANFIDITESEFSIDNTTFTHCKTIDQKDNRLFFANIKNDLGTYLETFDTRTYRFDSISNITRVKQFDRSTTAINYTVDSDTVYDLIPETDDNIPVYNLGLDSTDNSLYNANYKYKINSAVIGGSGLNIDYSFGNLFLNADNRADGPPSTPVASSRQGTDRDSTRAGAPVQGYLNGYRIADYNTNALSFLNSTFNNGSADQTYYLNSAKQTQGLEYYNDNFRTYELNEIYRFAIVFKAKVGTDYFAKWIGDIKFPDYADTSDPALRDYTASGAQCTDFRSIFLDTSGSPDVAYLNLPYIQFNVTIPDELANLISGYEIVRVNRTDNDMSILSHGFINQTSVGVGSENDNYFLPVSHSARDGGSYHMDPVIAPANPHQAPYASDEIITYHPFRELCDKQTKLTVNDKLIIAEKYRSSVVSAFNITGTVETGNYEEDYYISKYYNYVTTYNARFNILEAGYVEYGRTLDINGNTYKNYNYQWDDAAPTTYDSDAYALGCPTVVVSLEENIDWTDYNSGGNDVTSPMTDPPGTLGTGAGNCKLMAYHFKPTNLQSQYGGRTYLARTQNEYITTGAFCKVDAAGDTSIKVFGGDIYYGVQDTQKAIKNFGQLTTPTTAPEAHSQTWYVPTHSIYNIDLRGGLHTNSDLIEDAVEASAGVPSSAGEEQYFYAAGYSHFNLLKKYLPKPDSFNSTNEYKNTIYWSNVKINGSTVDDWSIIPVNNKYDVDGNYGGINSLITLSNNMYCVQDNAFSILHINPVSIITDQNNLPLNLGTGEVLQKHLYYSTDVGSKYQWSVAKSPGGITFVNGRYNKIYMFNGENLLPLSDVKGARGFMNKVMHDDILVNDNPIIGKGILVTYDYMNDEFLYTFRNNFIDNINERYTLVYSPLVDGFTSFYSFTPYIYINNHSKLYSPNDYNISSDTKIYMHNKGNYCQFYDGVFSSELKVLINDNPTKTKVFDNLSWSTESIKNNEVYLDDINDFTGNSNRINFVDDTIKSVRLYNEYQNTSFVPLTTTPVTGNLRKTEQGFNIQVPRNKVNWDTTPINTKSIFDADILTKDTFGERMRDKYIIVDLIYDNALSNRFSIHNVKTTYRTSDR